MAQAVFTGLVLGFALLLSLGPIVLKTIKIRINYGIASAFYFIAGVWIADFMWVTLANLFGSWLEQLNQYKILIGTLSGCLLLAIGIYYLFFKKYKTKEELDAGVHIPSSTHIRLFATGFLINLLNPSIIALWLAAAAKTVGLALKEKIVAFGIALGISILADIIKIELAGKIAGRLTNRNLVLINRASGIMFLVFGAAFILGALYLRQGQ